MLKLLDNELEEVLQHFGIKGMRWGIRKTQESARVKNARATLIDRNKKLKNAIGMVNKSSAYGITIPDPIYVTRMQAERRERGYAKEDLSNFKILDKLERKGKSKYQLKMEDSYKAKGLSSDEAAVAAYKNIRMKKVLAATAVLTIAVGAAKYRQYSVDKVIKAGSELSNVSRNADVGVRDAFYAANNKQDIIKYKGLYGSSINGEGRQAYQKTMKVLTDVNQASPKNAKKILGEMVNNDSAFKEELKNYLKNDTPLRTGKYSDMRNKAIEELSNGKVGKNAYEIFNAALVDHRPSMQKLSDSYFNKMVDKGYNAIKDVNDSKYSGYFAKNPIIAFSAKNLVSVDSVKKLSYEDVTNNMQKAYALVMAPQAAKQITVGVGAVAGLNEAVGLANKAVTNSQVKKYTKQHPGTKMTNTEIARMFGRKG